MRFEKFLLDDYLRTEEGEKLFSFFSEFRYIFFHQQTTFFNTVNSFLDIPEAKKFLTLEDPEDHHLRTEKEMLRSYKSCKSIEDFIEYYFSNEGFEDNPRAAQGNIPFWSVLYYIEQPKYAFPYLFPVHFYRFAEICGIFDIAIPPLPAKTKHLERIQYYFELCRILYDFQEQQHLSPVELCVFLYGFAPRFCEKYINKELPLPNNIHIVGAASEDVEYFKKNPPTEDTVSYWQGTEEMLPGDIIILYETSPYSRISSIWRAVSPGFDDPFHYYPGKVFMSHPVKVPCIKFDTLLSDPVWGKNGLVKAHMQGIGFKRTVVTHDEYESLKKLFKKQDETFDLQKLPPGPPPYSQFYHEDITSEDDVKIKLLEPLLENLGITKKEFITEFTIRMGRGERYRADYALHAVGTRNEEHADFIWEAKHRILTQKQLIEDYGQAKSYAIRLQTKGFGLVSLEGVKLWTASSHFDFKKKISYSWEELENPEKMGALKVFFKRLCTK